MVRKRASLVSGKPASTSHPRGITSGGNKQLLDLARLPTQSLMSHHTHPHITCGRNSSQANGVVYSSEPTPGTAEKTLVKDGTPFRLSGSDVWGK